MECILENAGNKVLSADADKLKKNSFPEFCSQVATIRQQNTTSVQRVINNENLLLWRGLLILKCECEQKTQPQCSLVRKVQ